jgi:hypothetical protein
MPIGFDGVGCSGDGAVVLPPNPSQAVSNLGLGHKIISPFLAAGCATLSHLPRSTLRRAGSA